MKNSCLSAAFVLASLIAIAQESTREYSRALKLYNLTDWEDYTVIDIVKDSIYLNHRQSNLRIFHPTIAYQWQSKKGNYHELELVALQFSRNEELLWSSNLNAEGNDHVDISESVTRAALSVRYEYQVSLRPKDEKSWDFYLGLGVNPYYLFYHVQPGLTLNFPSTVHTFGTRVFAVPRFVWHISPRVFFDVNLPVCLSEYRFQNNRTSDPTFPLNERSRRNDTFDFFPGLYSARVGIGIKLL